VLVADGDGGGVDRMGVDDGLDVGPRGHDILVEVPFAGWGVAAMGFAGRVEVDDVRGFELIVRDA